MTEYRVHFINHGSHVFGVTHFEAENDEAAKELARKQLRSGIGSGYEIWQEDRRVHTEIYR